MYEVQQSDQFHTNSERTGALRDGYEPCAICGRAVNVRKPHWRSYFHCGGYTAVTEEEYDALNDAGQEAAQMGTQAVGPECRKTQPELAMYLHRVPGL